MYEQGCKSFLHKVNNFLSKEDVAPSVMQGEKGFDVRRNLKEWEVGEFQNLIGFASPAKSFHGYC